MNKENTKTRWEDFDPGNYNFPPEGWVEIDEAEFASKFFMYISDKIDFRQLFLTPDSNGTNDAKLFWFYDEPLGVAIIKTYENMKFGVKYFRFGTEESWNEFTDDFCNQFRGDNS